MVVGDSEGNINSYSVSAEVVIYTSNHKNINKIKCHFEYKYFDQKHVEILFLTWTVLYQGEYYRSFSLPAHTRGVSSLLVLAQGTLLSAGERDRKVAAWDTARDFVMIGN